MEDEKKGIEIGIDGKKIAEIVSKQTATDESLNTEEQTETQTKEVDNKIPYDRFKAKVDEANELKAKLAKIEKAQAERERKELEEQNEYKTLYEQALKQAEQAKQESLTLRKQTLLAQAGYDAEQAGLLVKLVDGESDDEIAESIKQVQATIPVKDNYGDPSAFNGIKDKPKPVDAEEVGRNAVSRVLHKIKL